MTEGMILGLARRVASRPARWLAASLVIAAVLGASCSDGTRSVQGVIIQVEASSLATADSFTLRTNDGRSLVFALAPDGARDPTEGFVASHLRSHAALASQVVIFYREEDGGLLAFQMEDR